MFKNSHNHGGLKQEAALTSLLSDFASEYAIRNFEDWY
jgi:hypothetical protein